MQAALCWIAAQYIRLVWYTGRWRVEGKEAADRLFEQGRPLILATWHGRVLMVPYGWRHSDKVHILVSAHRDGRLIGRTLAHFNMQTVTGSTQRGGTEALRRMHRLTRHGSIVGLTPDGPRGPRMRISPGVVQLARLSGAPIFPLAFSARPCHVFETWDRFMLPFPFARGLYLWGEPITVARDADEATIEAARIALEESLNEITGRADAALGHPRIDPAPPHAAAKTATAQ